ncbi:MAG TPA: DUF512 domain-containing protein [Coriobacteriia bacterium]|nr:DUF512 domain-containing protein [Coriobacteriia bacterium]
MGFPAAKYGDGVPARAAKARIRSVDDRSPAHVAGLKAGEVILAVDGLPLTDVVDWLWLSDEDEIELELEGGKNVILTRDYGEPWGIDFDDVLFDGIRICRNNCMFCFMTMLPKGMRAPLYLRDDDYRLSFLQGNFVTLTNMDEYDVARVIEQHLSPLHVSLHSVNPEVRRQLMGRNHARGPEVLEELLAAGITVHAQIVAVPGVNDDEDLKETLDWIERRPAILSVGIVPYGYTKYAKLQRSFSAEEAHAVLERLMTYQKRARTATGETRFQPADEWFLRAGHTIPEAEYYGDFPQYEDGIGMLRAFIDEWNDLLGGKQELLPVHLRSPGYSHYLITGEAFAPILSELTAATPLNVLAVKNNFFGGNVDVAGLLTAVDVIEQVKEAELPEDAVLVLPEVMFNADGVTLDDRTPADIAHSLQRRVIMVPCSAKGVLETLDIL